MCRWYVLKRENRNDLFNKVTVGFSEMINHPDPEFRKKNDPLHTAFQLSYKTDVSFFGADGWLTKDPEEAVKFGLSWGSSFLLIWFCSYPSVWVLLVLLLTPALLRTSLGPRSLEEKTPLWMSVADREHSAVLLLSSESFTHHRSLSAWPLTIFVSPQDTLKLNNSSFKIFPRLGKRLNPSSHRKVYRTKSNLKPKISSSLNNARENMSLSCSEVRVLFYKLQQENR